MSMTYEEYCEQFEKGYDDSWLLEQKRAFIETLDHNSEVYKDYNLKLLQEQKNYCHLLKVLDKTELQVLQIQRNQGLQSVL